MLVHGSRPQIEARLKAQKIRGRFAEKLRITDAPALEAAMEVAGKIRVQIEALLSMGLPNSPMAGAHIRVASGNFVTARPIGVVDGVDLMHTGEVRKIDALAIERRLKDDELVVLSPLGYSPTGEVFNLSLGDVAPAAAVALKADKLIFLMESAGITGGRGELLRELTVREARGLLARGRIQSDETQAYLPAAVRACEQGAGRAHLISGHLDDSLLLEMFTHKGVGTLVTPDPLETLRHAKIDDIGGILRLIEPLEVPGPRGRAARLGAGHEHRGGPWRQGHDLPPNPRDNDTDFDGFSDGMEIAQGSDPNNPNNFPDNVALTGAGILGTKPDLLSTTETPLFHVGVSTNINDGNLTLWLNDVQKQSINYIDNETRTVIEVRLGAQGIDAGTHGIVYFDDFESRRFSYIGILLDPGVYDPQASNQAGWVAYTYSYTGSQPHAVTSNGIGLNPGRCL